MQKVTHTLQRAGPRMYSYFVRDIVIIQQLHLNKGYPSSYYCSTAGGVRAVHVSRSTAKFIHKNVHLYQNNLCLLSFHALPLLQACTIIFWTWFWTWCKCISNYPTSIVKCQIIYWKNTIFSEFA